MLRHQQVYPTTANINIEGKKSKNWLNIIMGIVLTSRILWNGKKKKKRHHPKQSYLVIIFWAPFSLSYLCSLNNLNMVDKKMEPIESLWTTSHLTLSESTLSGKIIFKVNLLKIIISKNIYTEARWISACPLRCSYENTSVLSYPWFFICFLEDLSRSEA